MADLALQILLSVQDAASNIISNFSGRFNQALSGLSPGLQIAAGAAMAFGGAVIGIGAASVKMAADYQQQMNMVQALTGSSSDQMAQYDSQVKALAVDAGVAPAALAQGLYQIISSGASGKQAMLELTLATQDSKIGMTDAATTAEALTNVLANFTWQTKDANLVNGEMLSTVTLGKSTFQQYATNITKAATVSQQYKISLETMSAAWATMTANGISAGKASTDYQQVVGLMYGKVGTLTKSLEKNGIAFNEAKFNSMSFGDKIVYLKQLLDEASKKHVQLTGVTLQAAQAITVIGGHMGAYQKDLKTLSDHQAMGQQTAQAWAITQQGFNQSMDRLNATVQVVMISIGQALLPVITRLVNWVSQGITSFMNWATHSQTLQTILHGLQIAFSTLGSWIGKIADYLSHNAAAMAAFKVMAIGIGGAVLGLIVAGFVALAIAAWSAAAGVIAATWPFLAIGAAIAVVIALVVLLIQHWGQIVSWLQGVWANIVGFFQGIWDRIVAGLRLQVEIWQMAWNAITAGVGNFFSGLGTFVHNGMMALVNGFLAPFRAIGALFSWLYNHNYYFKALIDSIRKIVQAGLTYLHNLWQTFINGTIALWNMLVSGATKVWNAVSGAVQAGVNFVVGWVRVQIQKHVQQIQQQLSALQQIWQQIWQKVSSVISSAWNTYIAKPLQNLWQSIVNYANGWPKQLYQAGVNMIQGFINGIKNMLGSVASTVQSVAKTVAKYLGFHSPAEAGPGAELGVWGPNLVKQFTSDIAAGQPKVQAALNTMISPLARVMNSTTNSVTPLPAASGGSASGHTFVFTTTVNGFVGKSKQDTVDYLNKELGRQMRHQANLVTQKSGGRAK